MLGKSHQVVVKQADGPDRLKRMITRTATPFAVALIIGFANPAHAELVADPPLPQFSKIDFERIERNATLRELYLYSPWLTFRVLRTIDAEIATKKDMLPPESQRPPEPGPFDRRRDPDLGDLQKAAPEAAVDLFAMIKRASAAGSSAK